MGEHKNNKFATKTLFHYTSLEVFRSIVVNKVIWATDLSKTNDPKEINLGLGILLEANTQIQSERHSEEVLKTCAKIIEELSGIIPISTYCCFCMTEHGDEIPMWRSYGGDFRGVSIGFHPAAFKQKLPFYAVEYINDDYIKFARESLLYISNFIISRKSYENPVEYYGNIAQLYSIILSAKDSGWEYEREIRGVISRNTPIDFQTELPGIYNLDPYIQESQDNSWGKYRNSRINTDILYTEIGIGRETLRKTDHTNSIKEIIIGPMCDEASSDMRSILEENGFLGVKITKSRHIVR